MSPRRALVATLCLLVPLSMTTLAAASATAGPVPAPNQAPVAVASANPNPAHAGDTVSFDGTGSYDAETAKADLSYRWSFPDGTTQAGYRVSKRFDQAGVFDVILSVSDGTSSDTDTVTLEVDDTAPVAKATATPSTVKVGQSVTLDASGSRDQETAADHLGYSWDFDSDGQADASGMTARHAYNAAGVYKARVTVTDPQGARDTATVDVTVTNNAPSAGATVTPNPAATGQELTFDGGGSSDAETADNDDLLYEWDFGDGGSTVDAHGKTVKHAYDTLGVKVVTLTVRDPQGLSDTAQVAVTVQPNSSPTAVAKADPTSANLDDDITFDGTGSSDAETPKSELRYEWDFGDGGSTTDASTAVATYPGYSSPGTKTATLTVTDGQGNSDTDTVQVLVGNQRPVAVATATPNPAKVDNAVSFDGTGSSDAETPKSELRYEWDFGDGSPRATSATAQHVYEATGSYTVTLRVKDAVGAAGTDTVTLQVNNTSPSATFTATPNPVDATQNVLFDASGTTDADSNRSRLTFSWDFGDGGEAVDATGPVVSHAYPAEGLHQVTLTVRDPHGGVDTTTSVVGVLSNRAPTAKPVATPGSAKVTEPVTFDGTRSSDAEDGADGEPLGYLWTFPDGTTSDRSIVTKAFATPGTRTVTLKVTDSGGLSDSRTVSVDVTNTAPVAVAKATPDPAKVDNAVSFDGTGSSDAETPKGELRYEWDFGDGSPRATTPTAQHTYPAAGSYTVTLTVTDGLGAVDSDTIGLRVDNTAPSASFTAIPRTVLVNRAVTFDGSGSTDAESPDRLSYAWKFGDGTTGLGRSLQKKYTAPGIYQARLTVQDPQSLSDTKVVRVLVAQRVSCMSSHVVRTGSWRQLSSTAATGGSYCDNLGSGAGADTLRLRAEGPRVALTYAKSAKGGIGKVYVDGEYQGRLDFGSSTKRPRFGYTRTITGLGSGQHTVKLVMVNGAGYIDDFLVWGKLRS